jgi:SAM-dependent methyltransferase
MYYFPGVYERLIKLLHSPERYSHIRGLVGKRSVLELGCGTGFLQENLEPGCRYSGMDLNRRFVDYGRKRGRNLRLGDIREYEPREEDGWDVLVLIDVLHHLPDNRDVLEKLVRSGKEVIMCEPFHTLPPLLTSMLFVVDSDGINDIRKVDWHDRESLLLFAESMGSVKTVLLNDSVIAVFNGSNGTQRNGSSSYAENG